jgi:hypothetical protein
VRGQSAILNLLTLLALVASCLVVAAVALLFVAPGIMPGFLRLPTEPAQVAALTPRPTATTGLVYPTLPPEWTATPSPPPSATPTGTPVLTATPTASPGPTGTKAASTAVGAATLAASAIPANVVKIDKLANVRTGPDTDYPIVARLTAGQTAPVIGRDSSAKWFAISFEGAPHGTGWVSILVASYGGSINDLPVIQPAAPPPPTAVPPTLTPSGPPAATSIPVVGGANGILTYLFQMHKTTGTIGESLFFDFKVVNSTGTSINNYGILAAHTDQGVTADSWHAPLEPGVVLAWTDHINFPNTGTYQVYLGICYSSHDACKTGGAPWTRLSSSVAVTIQ